MRKYREWSCVAKAENILVLLKLSTFLILIHKQEHQVKSSDCLVFLSLSHYSIEYILFNDKEKTKHFKKRF